MQSARLCALACSALALFLALSAPVAVAGRREARSTQNKFIVEVTPVRRIFSHRVPIKACHMRVWSNTQPLSRPSALRTWFNKTAPRGVLALQSSTSPSNAAESSRASSSSRTPTVSGRCAASTASSTPGRPGRCRCRPQWGIRRQRAPPKGLATQRPRSIGGPAWISFTPRALGARESRSPLLTRASITRTRRYV